MRYSDRARERFSSSTECLKYVKRRLFAGPTKASSFRGLADGFSAEADSQFLMSRVAGKADLLADPRFLGLLAYEHRPYFGLPCARKRVYVSGRLATNKIFVKVSGGADSHTGSGFQRKPKLRNSC